MINELINWTKGLAELQAKDRAAGRRFETRMAKRRALCEAAQIRAARAWVAMKRRPMLKAA